MDLISNSSSSLDHIPNTMLAHLVSSSDALTRSWKNQQVAHEESLLQQDLGPGIVNLVELEKGGAVVPAAVAGPDLLLGSSQDLHHVDNSSYFQKSLLQEWESMHATPGPTGLKIYDSLAMHAGLAATDSPVFNQAVERRSPAAGLQMFQSLPEAAAAAAAETAERASDPFQQLPLEQQCPLSNLSTSSLRQNADLVDHQQHMISPTSTLCSLDQQAHHQGLSSASISSSTSPPAANSVELLHAGSYLQKPAAADHSFILNMMQLLKNSVQSSSAGSLEISRNQSCSGTTTTGLVQHGPPTTISSPMFSSSSASSQSPPSPWQQQQSLNHDHKVEESIKLHLNAASPGISASSLISAETQEKQQQLNLISRSSLSPQTTSSSSSIISHSCSSSAAAMSQIPAAPSELLLMDHIPGQSDYTNMSQPSSCVSQSKSSSATTVGGSWSQLGSSMESKEYWTNMLQLVGPPASSCNQILTCATTVPTITNQ